MQTTFGSSEPFSAECRAKLSPLVLAQLDHYLDELEARRAAARRRTEAARERKAAADAARRQAVLKAVEAVTPKVRHLDERELTGTIGRQLSNPRTLERFGLDEPPDERTVRKALRELGRIAQARKRS